MRSNRTISAAQILAWQTAFAPKDNPYIRPLFDDQNRNQSLKNSGALDSASRGKVANQKYFSIASSKNSTPVLFKLISAVKESRGITDLFQYLNKEETVELETSTLSKKLVLSRDQVNELAMSWRNGIDEISRKNVSGGQSVLVRHGMMAFPKNMEKTDAMTIARNVLSEHLGNRGLEYVIAGHFNEQGENPHVHFVSKVDLADGTKFKFGKNIIFDFRESIAKEAARLGYRMHSGMAYQRGVKQQNVSRKDYEAGIRPSGDSELTEDDQKRLEPYFDRLRQEIKNATIGDVETDQLVYKRISSLSNKVGIQVSNEKNNVIDTDNNIER